MSNENVGFKVNLDDLNDRQREAATHMDGPLLIIAGAGSGKTKTIISRMAYLIGQGVRPENILLLTFTNKAANEMKSRAKEMVGDDADKVLACTFHSFCARELRRYADLIGFTRSFSVLSSVDASDAIGYIKARNKTKYNLKGFPKNAACAGLFSKAVNKRMRLSELIDSLDDSRMSKFKPELLDLFNEYYEYKQKNDMMDYDDLLLRYKQLLMEQPKLQEREEKTFKYMMVDEYQDTNGLQEDIVRLLRTHNNNIAVVGDDQQSIYAFRGAEIENILTFEQKFPGCKRVMLEKNYRSTQEICDVSNEVMSRHAKFGFVKKMEGLGYSGTPVRVVRAINQMDEAKWIFSKIADLHNQGVKYNDIAIIERSSYSSFTLESLLTAENIPFDKYGGLKMLEHNCVRDILAYMHCITNPSDVLSWFRVLRLYPGIGDTYAQTISSKCQDRDFLHDPKYSKRKFAVELKGLEKWYGKFKEMDYNTLLDELLDYYIKLRTRIIEEMDTKSEDNREEYKSALESDKETLKAFKNMALLYNTLNQLLDAIILDSTPEAAKKEDPVIITTIHSAKGLEFSYVFILDCVDGVFPSKMAFESNEKDDAEELRCFYVAMTRAKKELYIMAPLGILIYGRYEEGNVSRFLDNVGSVKFVKTSDE